jgi:DNA-binding GntR family transcriptional regulator
MTSLKIEPPIMTKASAGSGEGGELLHDAVYAELRWRLITGKIVPGIGLSTRGLAAELGVSPMPVREALGRLAAEGAVEIRSKKRITVPGMTEERFDDLLRCRLLLEPEAARLALPSIDAETFRKLKAIDDRLDLTLSNGDVTGYMEANFRFHFLIYQARGASILTQLIETLWLQFGPYMRVVYGRFGTRNLQDQHEVALDAIQAEDPEALVRAISADIADGMGLIGRHGLA